MAIWLKTAPGGRVIVGMATCGCAALPGGAAAMASGVSEEELTGVSAIDDRVTDFIDVRATAPGRWYSAPRFKATEDDDDDEEEDEGQGRAGCGPVQRPLAPDGSRAAVRANVLCISRLGADVQCAHRVYQLNCQKTCLETFHQKKQFKNRIVCRRPLHGAATRTCQMDGQ